MAKKKKNKKKQTQNQEIKLTCIKFMMVPTINFAAYIKDGPASVQDQERNLSMCLEFSNGDIHVYAFGGTNLIDSLVALSKENPENAVPCIDIPEPHRHAMYEAALKMERDGGDMAKLMSDMLPKV